MWDVKNNIPENLDNLLDRFTLTMWDVKIGRIRGWYNHNESFTLTMWDVKIFFCKLFHCK